MKAALVRVKNINKPGYSESLSRLKYEWMRRGILETLKNMGGGPVLAMDLEREVEHWFSKNRAPEELYPASGSRSLRWLFKTVQLDLEARNLIRRVQAKGRLKLTFL